VTGDLDNPKFSIAALVFDALTNVITKVVASPFTAIASLLGRLIVQLITDVTHPNDISIKIVGYENT
jgi:hypothetical protein